MDARLVVFIAFVAVTLIINTAMIFLAYKAFANMSIKLTEGVHEFQSSAATRQWLTTLQSTSEQAAKVTGAVKEQIVGLEPAIERLQTSYAESLARADRPAPRFHAGGSTRLEAFHRSRAPGRTPVDVPMSH